MLALAAAALAPASCSTRARVEAVMVHGPSLEGNLAGDPADRRVSVYLPPSYRSATTRRYPVLYVLHGFGDDDDHWFGRTKHFIDLPALMDRAVAWGYANEMIVVMPNAYTRFYGSMYSTSVTTGDWETFIATDLVAFVDARYRTLPAAASRAIAGHSMGGYGTLRLALKHPDVFATAYAMNACCLAPPTDTEQAAGAAGVEAVHSFDDLAAADFTTKLTVASAAAWSPNPARPPLFFDPATRGGVVQPAIVARWAANSPLATVALNTGHIRTLRGLAFDAGDKDSASLLRDLRALDRTLAAQGIAHTFEIYDGTHDNKVAERFTSVVLPFVSAHLVR